MLVYFILFFIYLFNFFFWHDSQSPIFKTRIRSEFHINSIKLVDIQQFISGQWCTFYRTKLPVDFLLRYNQYRFNSALKIVRFWFFMKLFHYPFAHQSIFTSGRRVRIPSQKLYVISSPIVTQCSINTSSSLHLSWSFF